MLKKGKNRKNWAAWLLSAALAGVLVICGLGGMKAVAGTSVDTNQECSLTVQIEPDVSEMLDETEILMKLYKVASIDENAYFGYKAESGFEGLYLDGLVEGDDMTAKAEVWNEQQEAAYEIISGAEKSFPYTSFSLIKSGSVYSGKLEEQGVGLYLLVVDSLYNKEETAQYIFSPRLIPLPMLTEGDDGDINFEYDLTVFLKYEERPLYGDLLITKHLTKSVSEYLPVSFVFHVTAVEDDGETTLKYEDGSAVYDNYVHAEFTASGTESILIEDFPAGVKVRVEEAYTGASYELLTGNPQVETIVAKDLVEESPAAHQTATVVFSNQYDGGETGGYGVTNHYEYNEETGGWSIVKKPGTSGSQAGDNTTGSGITNEVWQKADSSVEDNTGGDVSGGNAAGDGGAPDNDGAAGDGDAAEEN